MRVVGAPAVARGDVKVTVRAEADLAAVVIPVGLRDFKEHPLALQIHPVGVALRNAEFTDHTALRILLGVIDEDAPILSELGVTSESEQPFLVFDKGFSIDNVEELGRLRA